MIQSKRLLIRRVEVADWRAIRDIWLDFNRSQYAQYDRPHDTDGDVVRGQIARWAACSGSMEHLFFAVLLDATLIGYISFHLLGYDTTDSPGKTYEAGYCFHSAYHGHGYAREAMAALIGYLREAGAGKITAGTALLNLPSVALLQSCGFRQIATEQVSFYQDADGADIFFDGGVFERICATP